MTHKCRTCGETFEATRRDAKYCSPTCRQTAYNKRRKRAMKMSEHPTNPFAVKELKPLRDEELQAMAREIAKEQIEPVVREQISDAVVEGIGRMLAITPEAVEVARRLLEHPAGDIQLRAASLIMKYALSEKVTPQLEEQKPIRLEVEALPTPSWETDERAPAGTTRMPAGQVPVPQQALPVPKMPDFQECTRCRRDKAPEEFESGAPRCRACQAALRAELLSDPA